MKGFCGPIAIDPFGVILVEELPVVDKLLIGGSEVDGFTRLEKAKIASLSSMLGSQVCQAKV